MSLFLLCQSCNQQTEHVILKESHDLLVKCQECGAIHHVPLQEKPREITIKAIMSHEGQSRVCQVELFSDEICALGDLLVAECGDEIIGVEVTGIESGEKRKNKAKATEISTIWTRMIEEVVVKASIHEKRITLPLYFRCAGDDDFEIGKEYQRGNIRFRITHIKLRNGALMRKEGWKAFARKVKRLYGRRL